jgi:outer membrane protein
MMKIKFLIFGVLLTSVLNVSAQEKKDSVMHFSLAAAREYARGNSPIVKNAVLDLVSAKKKIWETTAIGLPQADAKYSYSYMLTVSPLIKQLSQFSSASGSGSDSTSSTTSYRTSSILDITVSQLVFSGSYIVGLQTSKVYKGLSELALTKSRIDLDESVTNSYILVLAAKENKLLLDTTYLNTLQILNTMKKIQQQGLIEETDVDQLQLITNSLKNAAELMDRQAQISERLLKFQLGLDLEAKIKLTDSIGRLIINSEKTDLLQQNFMLENNVDFRLMETQARLMKLNLMYNKSAFLPSVFAYYQHEKNFNSKAISFTPPDLVGVTVSVPLFSSGQRLARVGQARVSYEKALNSKQQAADGLKVSYEETRSTYISAVDNFNVAKENLGLAEKIYNRSLIKYKEGVISGTDLTQNQNQYIQSQTNYYGAIITLTSAKAKLEKLLASIQ